MQPPGHAKKLEEVRKGDLVIATPGSIVAGIGNAARQGVLIKGGEHLEKAGKIQVVVLDKTGTLTRGRPQVTGLWVNRGTETDMLLKAAAVEKLSEHPLAKPVVERAAVKGQAPEAADFRVLPGHGVMAMVAGKTIYVDNMAAADVGIAMGAAGTDVAMETADMVLMADRLGKLPYAIGLSRQTLRNIKQNVAFAVLVVLVLLLGVIGEVVVLASGMLVHEASVLLVILNAMRLLKYRETHPA